MKVSKESVRQYAETIMSMCLDVMNGGISVETFASNLVLFSTSITGKKFVEEKVGKWRRMGSYACASDITKGLILEDGSVAEGEGVITGFQCTVCGEKWYTPGFRFDGKEKTPAYCHCGARMECDKIQE